MNNLDDRIFNWFLKRARRAKADRVLSKTIVAKLCNEINGDPVEVRKAMNRLNHSGQLEFIASSNGEPISSYIIVNRPAENIPQHAALWQAIIANAHLSDNDKEALKPLSSHLEGFSESDMLTLLKGLHKLRSTQNTHRGEYGFSVSAKYLLGSSKLLSKFESRHLRAFGIDVDLFLDRPPYVLVGGNGSNPKAVILVENPISFEIAVQSEAAKHCAFVCTFGFGLSNGGNEFGYQLAGTVELGNAIILRRTEGSCMEFADLLSHENCQFWGDLDSAGMHIFMRLKRRLSLLKLSALYRPMISALRDPSKSHPYVESTGKVGQTPFTVGDSMAVELGRLCGDRSVCQEIVCTDELAELAGQTITLEDIH